ncbi:Folate-dependent protein for Fe/S cluster synthesis/repair in oxidative stress [Rhodovulum sp. PH10]|uniref:CAF17-like 4Fe-4S cluster assembly/insertion protein YgfZ n=1 Tax=Rhodovulum sp. PH10 TaxID=1187851 RepID=UPI00027C22E6|nr:folate-binding protein YgfZ [Rhodovulum sp. PH10]EJW13334.1 Folate-dependent protein for Fe/S cluster synthesis/repair in oxidative stress [Rhodovulum sp. PH10]
MQTARLPDRGVVKVSGDDARAFLHGLLTTDIAGMEPATPRFAALLTPQGKIVTDMLVVDAPGEGGFLLDVPRDTVAALCAKLKIYKLRAKVTVEDRSEALAVLAIWDGTPDPAAIEGIVFPDPRLPGLGSRAIVSADEAAADTGDVAAYEALRIELGVPRGGLDFAYGDTFPHEADMDQLAGVDFKKGCYVGQEVVSRMQHRGTTRTRVVPVALVGGEAPDPGTPVTAGELSVGTMGGSAGGQGLALLRLDRVADALAAGTPLVAGDATLAPQKPAWASFPWPGEVLAAR